MHHTKQARRDHFRVSTRDLEHRHAHEQIRNAEMHEYEKVALILVKRRACWQHPLPYLAHLQVDHAHRPGQGATDLDLHLYAHPKCQYVTAAALRQ